MQHIVVRATADLGRIMLTSLSSRAEWIT